MLLNLEKPQEKTAYVNIAPSVNTCLKINQSFSCVSFHINRFILISFLFLSIIACNSRRSPDNDPGKDTLTDDTYISTTPIPLAGCYSWVVNKDSASLELQVTDDQVTGSLEYNWFERDRNTGTLKGVVRDSMIYADYTFRSEGMTSVREVAFKIRGDSLVEGYGDFDEGSDTMRFADKTKLQFQDDRAFVKSTCKDK